MVFNVPGEGLLLRTALPFEAAFEPLPRALFSVRVMILSHAESGSVQAVRLYQKCGV